ncbi:uncharacterized protein RCO7_00396 [Rhynchosporium graminicola]|uniref:Uncharacterized protein n=1 Tax=Rhynchosporium graminicola TaxID=2792576 RepID=A0A1E1KLT7_9HELO|nr:uncharacterized protein RCO7_00396 [Rhynchosporium commune]
MVRVAVFPSLLLRHRLAENQDILLVGIPEEGGCFPGEYQCTTNGCIPMAGLSGIGTCSTGYHLCPASLNSGCCKSGSSCALSGCCWATSMSTFTYTNILTTTDANLKPHTLTTTIIRTTILKAPDPTQNSTCCRVLIIATSITIQLLKRAIRTSEQASSNTHDSSSGHQARHSLPRHLDSFAPSTNTNTNTISTSNPLPTQIQAQNNHRLAQVSQLSPSTSQRTPHATPATGATQVPSLKYPVPRSPLPNSTPGLTKSNSILASPASTGPGLGSPRSPHGMSSPREGLLNIPEAGEYRIGLEGGGGGVGVGRVGSKFGESRQGGRIRMGKLWGMERSG